MKFLHHLLRMSGYAYLHDIIQVGDQMVARIKAPTHFNPTSHGKDDVWIDVVICDFHQLARLNELLQSVRVGEGVMITFEAEYDLLLDAFSGQTAEDPSHIVTLTGKLLNLGECYINGCLVEQKTLLRAVA